MLDVLLNMRAFLTLILFCVLTSCSSITVEQSYSGLPEYMDDVKAYDLSNPTDLENIACTLPIFEVRSEDQSPVRHGDITNDARSYFLGGDGAQPSISIELMDTPSNHPIKIRLTIGAPTSEHMSVYILERGSRGWHRKQILYSS